MDSLLTPFATKIDQWDDIYWLCVDEPDMMSDPIVIANTQLRKLVGEYPNTAYKRLVERYPALPQSGRQLRELVGVEGLEDVNQLTITSLNLYRDDRCEELQLYLQGEARWLRYDLIKMMVSVECEDFDQMDYTLTFLFYKNKEVDVHLNINRLYRNEMRPVKGLSRTILATLAPLMEDGRLATVSLFAAGDVDTPNHIGYWYWPTLGFNATITQVWLQLATNKSGVPYKGSCRTVQDVIQAYGLWFWKQYGEGMRMSWDGILR